LDILRDVIISLSGAAKRSYETDPHEALLKMEASPQNKDNPSQDGVERGVYEDPLRDGNTTCGDPPPASII